MAEEFEMQSGPRKLLSTPEVSIRGLRQKEVDSSDESFTAEDIGLQAFTTEELFRMKDHDRRIAEEAEAEQREKFLDTTVKNVLRDSDIKCVGTITPSLFKGILTSIPEKAMELSYKFKKNAGSGSLSGDREEMCSTLEEFAFNFLEPLNQDEMKRIIFGGQNFNRFADKAVMLEQKKILSHPVIYDLLLRRWAGRFYNMRHSRFLEANWFKWIFLNMWCCLDVVFFPLVYVLLYVLHLITDAVRRHKECCVVFWFSKSSTTGLSSSIMQKLGSHVMQRFNRPNYKYAFVMQQDGETRTHPFSHSGESLQYLRDCFTRSETIGSAWPQMEKFLSKMKELFKDTATNARKVLFIISDDHYECELGYDHTWSSRRQLDNMNVANTVVVGIGENHNLTGLKTVAGSDENVLLCYDETYEEPTRKLLVKALKGKDSFERYKEYLKTPYFIFLRDALSYLALLALHFLICLEPPSHRFTVVEWLILVFFIGRILSEIHQVVAGTHFEKEAVDRRKQRNLDHLLKKEKIKIQLKEMLSKYLSDQWNVIDAITVTVYLVNVILRIVTWHSTATIAENRLVAVTGYLYGLNAMLLAQRVFGHIMESNHSTGAVQIALFKIIGAVVAIFGQFLAALLAFSLAITKIYVAEISYEGNEQNSNSTSSYGVCDANGGINCWWSSVKHLWWSLLGSGEVETLQSSDNISDFLVQLLYAIFLIMAVVMLMNMMIALLSNTYQHVEDNAFHEWSFRKAATIRTYCTYHVVPVPFNTVTLFFQLLRYLYRNINCRKCCEKPVERSPLQVELSFLEKMDEYNAINMPFRRMMEDLESQYFSTYGNDFPMSDTEMLSQVSKETEQCHQMTKHIAERMFYYGREERQPLISYNDQGWESQGMEITSQRLSYNSCRCSAIHDENMFHGARYTTPLSRDWPGFQVLIQDIGEDKPIISIGIVSEQYDLHRIPGMDGNTVGMTTEGKIFDISHPEGNTGTAKIPVDYSKIKRVTFDISNPEGLDNGTGNMAKVGAVLGCEILFDEQTDDKLPVLFRMNDRDVGRAMLTCSSESFYPCVSSASQGCVLHFKMINCCKKPVPNNLVTQQLDQVMDKLNQLNQNYTNLLSNYVDLQQEVSALRSEIKKDRPDI